MTWIGFAQIALHVFFILFYFVQTLYDQSEYNLNMPKYTNDGNVQDAL